jgi:three-Cys-motif partner protein
MANTPTRSTRKTTDIWLNQHVDQLLDLTKGVTTLPNGAFDARSWTWLKLAALDFYFPVYLRILEPLYDRLVFVDLFVGSGVSRYHEGGLELIAPSSALVAASYRNGGRDPRLTGFDEVVTIEKDPMRAHALEDVLRTRGYASGSNLHSLVGDANEHPRQVLEVLSQHGTHALVFADPEGLDLHFETIRSIVDGHKGTDLFITHLVSGAARAIVGNESPTRDAMYGTDEWRRCSTRAQYTALYERQLRTIRDIVLTIPIGGDFDASNYYYDLVFAVRETSGGSEWSDSIEKLRRRVETLSGKDVARILRTRAPAGKAGARTRQRSLEEPLTPAPSGTGPTSDLPTLDPSRASEPRPTV